MKPGDPVFVHVPLADFRKAAAEVKEKQRKWKFTDLQLDYHAVTLTITSGAGVPRFPPAETLRASASLSARNFLRIFNALPKSAAGELAIGFLPKRKLVVTDKVEVKATRVATG